MDLRPGQRVVHRTLGLHGTCVQPQNSGEEQPYVLFDGCQITEPSPVSADALVPESSI